MADLKYPVIMVHGMGFRDYKHINYWGRIPAELEKAGCRVFYGNQDSNGDAETNGASIKKRIEEILLETGAEKVNIIAHSKGGLDSRYAISTLGIGGCVASLTTLSTPHHGSKTVDKLLCFPNGIIKFGCFLVDIWFKILGDKQPNTYKVIHSFTTEKAKIFNEHNVDDERVYYQSFAFVMKSAFSDMFMWIPSSVVKYFEGENDGLLTPEGVRWTNFKGVYRGVGRRGISHCDEIDLRRRPLSKKSGEGISDIVDFYRDVVEGLKEMGF